jgi:putative transposase
MSWTGNPYHSTKLESFVKALKQEQVNVGRCTNLDDCAELSNFFEHTYNRARLQSALGDHSPAEFEAHLTASSGQVPRAGLHARSRAREPHLPYTRIPREEQGRH